MTKNIFYGIIIFISLVLLVWFQLKDPNMGSKMSNLISSANAKNIDIFKGMELYTKNCASCHMGNLAGHEEWNKSLDEDGHRRAPPLNGTGHTWHHSPEYLFQVTKYGFKKTIPDYEGKMLGNDTLSDDDVWSILEFIKSTWPEEILKKYNSHFKN